MLEFYRGNSETPSGSLLFYCRVRGPNPFSPDAKLLVCHVVVSYLGVRNNNFPVVVFPPSALTSEEEFFELLDLDEDSDVVRLEDFEIPEGKPEADYMSERLERFNDRVYEYVEIYRKQLDRKRKKHGQQRLPLFPEQPLLIQAPDMDDAHAIATIEQAITDGLQSKESIQAAVEFLKHQHPQLDMINLESAVNQEDLKLSALYLDKFKAILEEKYEDAARIQVQIRNFNPAG
ncbi:MAG TPA: hypothetical protein PLW55_10630 [Leptospiraceae bacterium]|jgi:hypothetical protein|nr:hypothetical protein [Leptospiraceae bacterium]